MNAPLKLNLNAAVPYTVVCTAFKAELTDTTPPSVPCFICHKGILRVYKEIDDGSWWACDTCRFAGPTLPAYQKARNILETRPAWLELLRDTGVQVNQQLLGL